MLTLRTLPHDAIVLDMCCIITLHASGQMEQILEATKKQIVVAEYVYESEVTKIDLSPLVSAGMITIVPFANEEEEITAVNFAAVLEDGEAFSGALASHRNWAIATDERKALNYFASNTPHIARVTTPDFIHHWVVTTQPSPHLIRTVLQNIQSEGRYIPGRSQPLREWWISSLNSENP